MTVGKGKRPSGQKRDFNAGCWLSLDILLRANMRLRHLENIRPGLASGLFY
jgi:hypothetical protein